MTTESLLLAILVVLTLILILAGLTSAFLIGSMRGLRAEHQAMRRYLAAMDWTTVFSNMQAHAKESVRILDILDKRLQKLEAMEKVQISQSNPNFRA